MFEFLAELGKKFIDHLFREPGGIVYLCATIGVVGILIICWKAGVSEYSLFAIGAIVLLVLLVAAIHLIHKRWPVIVGRERELKGRYFIGIDLGRKRIDYCLMDCDKFEKSYKEAKVLEGVIEPTPKKINKVYIKIEEIIKELSTEAWKGGFKPFGGIGIGLPGQVDPKTGVLIRAPGFEDVGKEQFVNTLRIRKKELSKDLINQHPEVLDEKFPIAIDNDVRCATRAIWKTLGLDDVICISVGNGLGSGIVLGGKMLYGYTFTAGEIGHVTISDGSEFSEEQKCKCGREGGHWEMYASSYGMMNIAKNSNREEYKRLKEKHGEIIKQGKYPILLEDEKFGKYRDDLCDKKTGELTTYFFRLAFYAKEGYAVEVVEKFIKYLAIGIANYVNVINPRTVHLGGGMIEAFYTDDPKAPANTIRSLRKEFEKYALSSAANDVKIEKGMLEETRLSSMGAALIFRDQSYFDYKNKK